MRSPFQPLFRIRPAVGRLLAVLLLAAVGTLGLGGCMEREDPDPFQTGEPVPPPAGCTEGRTRGVDC